MVEFVLISILLCTLLFGVVQVAAVLYARSVVESATSDGARYGANAEVAVDLGATRASALISAGLGPGAAASIPCSAYETTDPDSGLLTANVECRGRVRSVFLPLAAFVTIGAKGRSLKDRS